MSQRMEAIRRQGKDLLLNWGPVLVCGMIVAAQTGGYKLAAGLSNGAFAAMGLTALSGLCLYHR